MTLRLLLLYASAGNGHARAAEALAHAYVAQDPTAEVILTDILEFTPAIFRNTYAKGYLRIVRTAPELWGYMYALSDRKASIPWRRKVRRAFNEVNTVAFRRYLKQLQPDAIICTHFMPLELLSDRAFRRISQAPRYCAITDFAVHALWMTQGVTRYFVATDDARDYIRARAGDAVAIHVTGIPIDPVFSTPGSRLELCRTLGVATDRHTILVMSGGFGVGPTRELLRSFQGCDAKLQLIIVAGANTELRRDCETLAAGLGVPCAVHGFVSNIHELIAVADLVVSKPGGLTSSEVMAMGKPMVIVDPIPGQEQRNCEFLLEAGAATRLYDVASASAKLAALLSDRERLARMRQNAVRIGRPHAAATVIDRIRQDLVDRSVRL